LTPFKINARVELPSRAARDFNRRWIPSGMSTVVRIWSLCHIYGAQGLTLSAPFFPQKGGADELRPLC
jgi:hypothetical protein